MPQPQPLQSDALSNAPLSFRRGRLVDLCILAVIAGLWCWWFYADVTRILPVAFDTFRDSAAAENVLADRWLSDPAIVDQPYWYAPLGPIVFACISRLTGIAPLIVYSSSILWLNVLLPFAWYLLARYWCDRWTALAGVLLIIFGSRWWTIGVALPMTSVQGVLLLTITLIAWLAALRAKTRVGAAAVGFLLAFCTWTHIISGIIAAGTIGLHALACARAGSYSNDGHDHTKRHRHEAVRRMVLIAVVCAGLVAPLAWHLMRLPHVNLHSIEFVSPLLRDHAYALQSATPLVPLLGLVGLILAWRDRGEKTGMLLAYAAVGLAGQAWGYASLLTGGSLPILIPHEFQWNFQIAIGMSAAYALAGLAAKVAALLRSKPRVQTCTRVALLALIVYLATGSEVSLARPLQSQAWHSTAPWYRTSLREAIDWINSNTSIDDVVFSPHPFNYTFVGGATGRKLVGVPVGQANIAVDTQARVRDAERLESTHDPAEFAALLDKYDVKYVLLLEEHEELRQRWRDWDVLEPVFRTDSGAADIWRIKKGRPPAAQR